jgi:hypothetical protein
MPVFELDPPPSGGTYATAEELRDALGVDDETLTDDRAEDLLEDASNEIDRLLYARPIDPDTGRKVKEGTVQGWQWDRIVRATVKVAAQLYENPGMLTEQQFDRVKGPDFETQGPLRKGVSIFGDDVLHLVSGSGLAIISGRGR